VTLAYDHSVSDTRAFSPRGGGFKRASDVTAFGGPDWTSKAAQRFVDLIRLPEGWDGHKGRPVLPPVADYAYQLLQKLMLQPGLPLPSITPLAYGGIMLEWHRRGLDVEIEIDAPACHRVYICEIATGTEQHFQLGPRLDRLRDVMTKVAD
jgi:hypothetical protein